MSGDGGPLKSSAVWKSGGGSKMWLALRSCTRQHAGGQLRGWRRPAATAPRCQTVVSFARCCQTAASAARCCQTAAHMCSAFDVAVLCSCGEADNVIGAWCDRRLPSIIPRSDHTVQRLPRRWKVCRTRSGRSDRSVGLDGRRGSDSVAAGSDGGVWFLLVVVVSPQTLSVVGQLSCDIMYLLCSVICVSSFLVCPTYINSLCDLFKKYTECKHRTSFFQRPDCCNGLISNFSLRLNMMQTKR